MNSPFISWQEWEGHVLDFFHFALEELIKENNLPHLEADKVKDNLNRRLSIVCKKNRVSWDSVGKRPTFCIYYNGRNQPRAEDEYPHQSENKEPDIQVAAFTDTERMTDYFYTVECKRLDTYDGSPHNSSQYYVNDGILRFVKRAYSYGIDVESGLMIGYVQSADFETFLLHVNNYCAKIPIPVLSLAGSWNQKGVSRLDQKLIRTEMEPKNFQLRHFWVDLREFVNCVF